MRCAGERVGVTAYDDSLGAFRSFVAMPRPIPLLPPVMRTLLFCNFICLFLSVEIRLLAALLNETRGSWDPGRAHNRRGGNCWRKRKTTSSSATIFIVLSGKPFSSIASRCRAGLRATHWKKSNFVCTMSNRVTDFSNRGAAFLNSGSAMSPR